MPRKLHVVVAACNNNGIGINGNLPWRIKKDMEFFKRITTDTINPDKQNAVIMGRKTWFSIPEKFRPLKGRMNIVLSRELKEVPTGVHIARSLPDAISLIETELSDIVENIHIIGGSSVYKSLVKSNNPPCKQPVVVLPLPGCLTQEAMTGPYPCRIYLTRVLKEFECDTFLPEISDEKFTKIANPDNVPLDLQEENNIKFRFEVYEKVIPTNGPMECLHSNYAAGRQPIKFDVMAAMCHNNRGIGYKMRLPWPKLTQDYEYYTTLVSTLKSHSSEAGHKKIIQIRGRKTWLSAGEDERNAPNVYTIIVSSTWTEKDFNSPRVLKVVPTFDDAIAFVNQLDKQNEVDSVWIMGGFGIYQEALEHPQFGRLYLTHVYKDFPADAFFPQLDDTFQEVEQHPKKGEIIEENGVEYEFKVYSK